MKLSKLREIVAGAINEGQLVNDLREHATSRLGILKYSDDIVELASAINERMDAIKLSGYDVPDLNVELFEAIDQNHSEPEVRKLLARILPVNRIGKYAVDESSKVRCAVAERVNENIIKKMIRRFPDDDQLRVIFREKRRQRLAEAAEKTTEPDVDLSDAWYENKAIEICRDYNNVLDRGWQIKAAKNFCSSTKATSGVVVDCDKLVKAINDVLKVQDERNLELSENRIVEQRSYDYFDFSDIRNPVQELLESSNFDYVNKFVSTFNLKYASLTAEARKFMLSEGLSVPKVPAVATLPHDGVLNESDEKALDRFCECWNRRQEAKKEPLVISWFPDPSRENGVLFKVSVKS